MERNWVTPKKTEEVEEEEDGNDHTPTPNNPIHNQHFSNPRPVLHPSYTGALQSPPPRAPQVAGPDPSLPIPTNWIAPSLHQRSLNLNRYPYRFSNPQTPQMSPYPLPFHVNGYPYYMTPAGPVPAFYPLPMPNFMVPPPIPRGMVHPTLPQYRARQPAHPQTNYTNEIIAPRPRRAQNFAMQFLSQTNNGIPVPPAQNHAMQFLSQTNNDNYGVPAVPARNSMMHRNSSARVQRGSGNINPTRFRPIQSRASEIYPPGTTQFDGAYNSAGWAYHGSLMDQNDESLASHPMLHSHARQQFGSDHLPFAHERPHRPDSRPHRPDSRFNNRRSQNRTRERGHVPEYIGRDRSVHEQPREVEDRCDICNEDLFADSTNNREINSRNNGNRSDVQSITETAVLPCQHAFHMSCFQMHSNPGAIDLAEPPCPICCSPVHNP